MSDAINANLQANTTDTTTAQQKFAEDVIEGVPTTTPTTTQRNSIGSGIQTTTTNNNNNDVPITSTTTIIIPMISNTNTSTTTTSTPIIKLTKSSDSMNYGSESTGEMPMSTADVSHIIDPLTDIIIEKNPPSAMISNALTTTTVAVTTTTTTTTIAASANSIDNLERNCWICFATEEDNRMAAWVQPCKCRGTTKWVHQSCLYRWIDEKQKGNALKTVCCQQCQTEYIIVFPQIGKIANVLESFDNLIKRLSPFLAAGIFVGSLYWTAVTYGAVTFLQVFGHKKGLALMENGDPLILLLGLPAIPVGLVLGRMIRWEDAILRLIRNRRTVARKFPLMNFIIPYPDEDEEQYAQHPATPTLSDPVSATRIFCGALLLPTISSIVGRLLFESIDNTLHRTLLGGLTFITVKGILKIYLKQQQYTRKKKRRIIDYNEENLRSFVNRNTIGSRYFVATAATPRQQQPDFIV